MAFTAIHTADVHIDANRATRINPDGSSEGFESATRVFMAIVDHVIDYNPDLFVISGDMFLNGRPNAEAVGRIADGLRNIARYSTGTRTVLLPGNHDMSRLRASHRTVFDSFEDIDNVTVFQSPGLLTLDSGLQVVGLPWSSKRDVVVEAQLDQDWSMREWDRAVSMHVDGVIERFAEEVDDSRPAILAAHLTASNARISSGKRGSERELAPMASEYEADVERLTAQPWSYGALGHIHLRQEVCENFWYPGSPETIDFSEAEYEKSVNHITIDEDGTHVKHLPLPARKLHVLRDDLVIPSEGFEPGTLVRVELRPGVTQVAPDLMTAIAQAGGIFFDTKRRPTRSESSEVDLDLSDEILELSPIDAAQKFFDNSNYNDKTAEKALELIQRYLNGNDSDPSPQTQPQTEAA